MNWNKDTDDDLWLLNWNILNLEVPPDMLSIKLASLAEYVNPHH